MQNEAMRFAENSITLLVGRCPRRGVAPTGKAKRCRILALSLLRTRSAPWPRKPDLGLGCPRRRAAKHADPGLLKKKGIYL